MVFKALMMTMAVIFVISTTVLIIYGGEPSRLDQVFAIAWASITFIVVMMK